MAAQYIEVDHSVWVKIDDSYITIEGADLLVRKIKKSEKTTRPEDYLGIGNPLIYR